MINELIDFGVPTQGQSGAYYQNKQPWGMVVSNTAMYGGVLTLSGSSASWILEAAKKLEALGRLPAGWDSHGGVELDPDSQRLTVSTLGWLEGEELPVPAVVLGSSGTVHLEWHTRGRELEIELGQGSAIDFVKVHPNGRIEEGGATADLLQAVRGLTWWLIYG